MRNPPPVPDELFQPKKKRKQTKLNERALVTSLLRFLKVNTPYKFYVYVDRDSGSERNTKSGWDFLIAARGLVRFCEAKSEKGMLSPHQILTMGEVNAAENTYLIVRFVNVKSLVDFDVRINRTSFHGVDSVRTLRAASIQVKDIFAV